MPDEKADYTPAADPKLVLQARKLELEAEAKRRESEVEAKRMDIEAGWLGRIVGSSKNASTNMAFLIVLLAFAAGFVFGIAYPNDRLEFWKLVSPIITLTLGYLFGRNSKS